jgi:hypothetical protein
MITVWPLKELEAERAEMQFAMPSQLFTSLPRLGGRWFANHKLQRTAAGRRRCNRPVSWPPLLSLGC